MFAKAHKYSVTCYLMVTCTLWMLLWQDAWPKLLGCVPRWASSGIGGLVWHAVGTDSPLVTLITGKIMMYSVRMRLSTVFLHNLSSTVAALVKKAYSCRFFQMCISASWPKESLCLWTGLANELEWNASYCHHTTAGTNTFFPLSPFW